ncbi:MAG: hypothetical protein U5P41_10510 [Gammaproteobacteria bacterium]|nr:hypothetical protein [Gammaproteobacteria bacterium]
MCEIGLLALAPGAFLTVEAICTGPNHIGHPVAEPGTDVIQPGLTA